MDIGGRIPPLLGVNELRWSKEGRYLIALAHERTMGKRFPFTHWLIMDIGGRIPPLLEAFPLSALPYPPSCDFLLCIRRHPVARVFLAGRPAAARLGP
jgi:hypothetical protein